MEANNLELVQFCISKIGTPYVMGTSGRVLTQAMYNDLVKRNPGGWFIKKRLATVRSWIGMVTADCHGLIEWFVREVTGRNYDVTADGAYAAAKVKDVMGTLPERPGICVRYRGHVGVYIGGGYVVEARGFDHGVCITRLSERPFTHWYEHPEIAYTGRELPAPKIVSAKKDSDLYDVVWLQIALNRQIGKGKLSGKPIAVDGIYGRGTAEAAAKFWRKRGWTKKDEIWGIGKHTIKALS